MWTGSWVKTWAKEHDAPLVKHWHRLPREVVDWGVPGNVQGQVGQGSEQPDLVEDVPAHCRGGWTR